MHDSSNSFSEFKRYLADPECEPKLQFKIMDKDGNGFITASELKKYIEDFDSEKFEKILQVDHCDGKISYTGMYGNSNKLWSEMNRTTPGVGHFKWFNSVSGHY